MRMSYLRNLSSWIALLAVVMAFLPTSIMAQESTPTVAPEPPSFLLEPLHQDDSFFTATMDPGTTQEMTVALGSASEAPVTVLTYVSDAKTLVNGGFGVGTADDPVNEPTTWIDYPTETLELEPDERLERTFTISVPTDAAPGQHIAGLSIQTAESLAVGESGMLRQIIKKSIAVFIIVPGPQTPDLEIGEARMTQSSTSNGLVVDIRNSGNVFLKPEGTIEMTTVDGRPVMNSPVTMGPVYAGTETTLELHIPTMLKAGDYIVSLSLHDAEQGVSVEESEMNVRVEEAPVAATPMSAPITVSSASIEPITAAGSSDLQAVNVMVTLENPATTLPSAQLTLHATRDGELVENYPLNSSLVVQAGATEIQQRYIPLESWEHGEYRFSLTLEAIDPVSGQITVLLTHTIEDAITIP